MLKIEGRFSKYSYDGALHIAAIAQDDAGIGPYLIVQWQDYYDTQDIVLGHNVPYIEISPPWACQYGRFDAALIESEKIEIKFEASSEIGRHHKLAHISGDEDVLKKIVLATGGEVST